MFVKIHAQIFSSSIMEYDLETRYVWFCLLTLADQNGFLDITIPAISRRINLKEEIVEKAIALFCKPDKSSRTPDFEGRRLEKIRETFGWKILNYEHYRNLRNEESRREYMRDYMRKQREKSVNNCKLLLTHVNTVNNCKLPLTHVNNVNNSKLPFAQEIESRRVRELRELRESGESGESGEHQDIGFLNEDISKTSGFSPLFSPPLFENHSQLDSQLASFSKRGFDRFWKSYPARSGSKHGKKNALKIWEKLNPSEGFTDKILNILELAKKTEQWEKGFVMDAARWLRGEHWNDELEKSPKRKFDDELAAELAAHKNEKEKTK